LARPGVIPRTQSKTARGPARERPPDPAATFPRAARSTPRRRRSPRIPAVFQRRARAIPPSSERVSSSCGSVPLLAQAAGYDPVELGGEARAGLRRERRGAARRFARVAARREQIAHRERAADRILVELAAGG